MSDLMERRNSAAHTMRSILEEAGKDGMTPEQETAFDAAAADFDRLDATVTRSAKIEALSATVPVSIGTGTAANTPEVNEQHRAFEAFIRHGMTGEGLQRATDLETRAQGVATGSAGGFLVPDTFAAEIIKARKAFGGIRAVARTISTSRGEDLIFPTIDDTGNTGAWIGENTAVTEQDVVVGNLTLGAHKATSKLVRVSNELLQDETYNLAGELGVLLGERIGRLEAPSWLTGTGTGQPTGLLNAAVAGVTLATGSTTGFASSAAAYDALIDLEHSIDPAYRAGSTYVMNDLTVAKVRKVKDADGRPIWQPALTAGAPSTINGYPVITDPAMPVMAANAKSVVFGNMRESYIIRDVLGIAVRRLNERFAEFDQVGFLAFARVDGQVLTTKAYRVLVNSAT